MSSITTISDQTTASTLAKHTLLTLLALQDSLTACPPRIRDAYEASALENACSRWLQLRVDIKAAESGRRIAATITTLETIVKTIVKKYT
ncbi:hypothetical protein BJX65DRAFT_304536 [Aspergillus insuetus]